jgi:hypothetical protein
MHLLYQQLEYFQGGSAASHDNALNAVFIQEIDQGLAAPAIGSSIKFPFVKNRPSAKTPQNPEKQLEIRHF